MVLALNAAAGDVGVLLGFVAAVMGMAVIGWGLFTHREPVVRSGRIYAWLILGGAVLAVAAMEHALLTHDFRIVFVAQNNARRTPLLYTITGLWSALAGSILLWALVLSIYLAAMVWHFRRRAGDSVVAWATFVVYGVAAFFFALMVGPANPFRTVVGAIPAHGLGPNELLQDNPLVLFHPPLLYAGFVGFTIPFSFAIASLITGRMGEGWLLETRRWTLVAWGCLTLGIILGAWWSYQVLGWGGFWAWDPVENAALLPWLCGTAFLHSVVAQERRGVLRVWNLTLVISAFTLTILATFLTRSGVVESVHAFSNSNLGPVLLGFLGVIVAMSIGLIAWRGDKMRSPVGIDSMVSREGLFLLNNLLFAAFAFVVLVGTLFPLLVEALQHHQATVGSPYFDDMATPVVLTLLFLMAIAPVLPWRKTSPGVMRRRLALPAWVAAGVLVVCVVAGVRGFAPLVAFSLGAFAGTTAIRQLVLNVRASRIKSRSHKISGTLRGVLGRTSGGMVVHVGIVVMAVAFAAASSYGQRGQVVLRPGQSTTFDGQHLEYVGTRVVRSPSRVATEALVMVNGHGPYTPAVSQFDPGAEGVGTPAIDSTPEHDVYLTVVDLPSSAGQSATLGVVVQPLIMWLWLGAGLIALGILLALVPASVGQSKPASETQREERDDPGDGGGWRAREGIGAKLTDPSSDGADELDAERTGTGKVQVGSSDGALVR